MKKNTKASKKGKDKAWTWGFWGQNLKIFISRIFTASESNAEWFSKHNNEAWYVLRSKRDTKAWDASEKKLQSGPTVIQMRLKAKIKLEERNVLKPM